MDYSSFDIYEVSTDRHFTPSTEPLSDIQSLITEGATTPLFVKAPKRGLVRYSKLEDSGVVQSFWDLNDCRETDLQFPFVVSSSDLDHREVLGVLNSELIVSFGTSLIGIETDKAEIVYQRLQQRLRFQMIVHPLSKQLNLLGFSECMEYEDVLGGFVVDFYRDSERITCIVSSESIQILSYINDSIASQEFIHEESTVETALEHVRTLFE